MRLFLIGVFSLGALTIASSASAHIYMTAPQSRYANQDHQKYWPCGDPNNAAGEYPVVDYTGGETITITYNEYIPHFGHLRVSIAESDQDFTLLTAFDDFDNDPTVYMDDIDDAMGGGVQSFQFEVPDIDCNPCVLQLMQVMYDDGVYTPVTPPTEQADLYFQCAEITITPTGVGSTGPGTTGADSSSDETGGVTNPGDSTGNASDPSTSGATNATTVGETAVTDATMTPTTATVTDTDVTAGGGDEGDDSGCSCRSSSEPKAVLFGLFLIFGLARRRV